MTRRAMLGAMGGAAGSALARPALSAARPQVVVVGGGPAGLAAARTLAADATVDVILVERNPTYRAPWMFNAILGGLEPAAACLHGYLSLAAFGISVRHQAAVGVDPAARVLHLEGGDRLPWDHLVLAPGIGLRGGVEGADLRNHGWTSEAGIEELAAGLARVPDGGTVVLVTPPLPMRCPPAPYERASMMAHRLRSTGRQNARVMVLDAKESGALLGLFQAGWETIQPGMVEWLPPSIHGGVARVEAGSVATGLDTIAADLVCVVPPQAAGPLAAPFSDASGWCPIDFATMRARAAPAIAVVGDAASLSPVPKSAVAAAASGRIAARAILAELGRPNGGAGGMENLCWGRLAPDNAIRSADTYALDGATLKEATSAVSSAAEPAATRAETYAAARRWAAGFTTALLH